MKICGKIRKEIENQILILEIIFGGVINIAKKVKIES